MNKIIKGIGITLLAAGVIGAITMGDNKKATTTPAAPTVNPTTATPQPGTAPAKVEEQKPVVNAAASNWDYEETVDKMRGENKYNTTTKSINTLDFGFPYNKTQLAVVVRNYYKKNEVLLITNSQFQCSITEACYINAKFDDGSVEKLEVGRPENYNSSVLFVEKPAQFIEKLRSGKNLILETPIFQVGDKQFEFKIDGLKWEH